MRWTRVMLWLMSGASGIAIAAIMVYVSKPETVPMLVPLVGIAIAHLAVLVVVMLVSGGRMRIGTGSTAYSICHS